MSWIFHDHFYLIKHSLLVKFFPRQLLKFGLKEISTQKTHFIKTGMKEVN